MSDDKFIYIIITRPMKPQTEETEMGIQGSDDEEDIELYEPVKSKKEGIFAVILLCTVIAGIILAGAIALKLAFSLQTTPLVYISADKQTFSPPLQISFSAKSTKINEASMLEDIQKYFHQLQLGESSPEKLVAVQQINSAHIMYNRALRSLDYQNMQKDLSGYSREMLTVESKLIYEQYIRAIGLLQLTTYSNTEVSQERMELQQNQRKYIYGKYNNIKQRKQLSICVILMLTKNGLQSGNYYYSLKSIFQQTYYNYKVVVANTNPQMKMSTEIVDLVRQAGEGRGIVVQMFQNTAKLGYGAANYHVLHKYCADSQITLLMRDSGQLIGKHVFSLLSQAHQSHQTGIVISNYLLQLGGKYVHLQDNYRYKVPLFQKQKQNINIRAEPYKTKYLKSYSTDLLLHLPYTVFQNSNSQWRQTLFEANLQFAAIEIACGHYYLLQQILYKAVKQQIQSMEQVDDARKHFKFECGGEMAKSNDQRKYEISLQTEQFVHELVAVPNESFNGLQNMSEYIRSLIDFKLKRQIKLSKLILETQQIKTNLQQHPDSHISIQKINDAIRIIMTNPRTNIYQQYQPTTNKSVDHSQQIKQPKNEVRTGNQSDHKNIQTSINTGSLLKAKYLHSFCILLYIDNHFNNFQTFYSLDSIMRQQYSNYNVFIIDNASNDSSIDAILQYIKLISSQERAKIKVYKNGRKKTKAENIYYSARYFCGPEQILMFLDGQEELIDSSSLAKINEVYSQNSVLSVYSNAINIINQTIQLGPSQPYEVYASVNHQFRSKPLYFNRLQTYRMQLFLNIDRNDLKDSTKRWIQQDFEFAINYPILEMSCDRIRYLNQILIVTPSFTLFPIKQLAKERQQFLQSLSIVNAKFSPVPMRQSNVKTQYKCLPVLDTTSQLRGNP